jgi:hypothetical protein
MRLPRFRRGSRDPALTDLLADPVTVLAAVGALDRAGGGRAWWPYAALVRSNTVHVHIAGRHVPAPTEPWLAGHDPHVWVAARTAVRCLPWSAVCPAVLGRFGDGVVIIDAARAPGPLAVMGRPDRAPRLYALLSAQLPDNIVAAGRFDGPHRPVIVGGDGVITVTGLALAVALPVDLTSMAADLVRSASKPAAEEPANPPPPASPATGPVRRGGESTTANGDADGDDIEHWLRDLKAGAATHPAMHQDPASNPHPAGGSHLARHPHPAGCPQPASEPGPDYWADVAVSSAHEQ